ncbi:thioredoxin family protein [Desulfitibacter alkalitolerans]|uniref:thioredoxin family protein n=1 Tax=Desulfitibacter alkalitolerans TaxID=264641 RepID=UPI000488354C|nr:thioredoxin family protein [Desulfitibacter alkalitolerans]
MEIKVLGPGCMKCEKLYELVKEVVQELGVDANLKKITDIKEIAKMGIMLTPGLVINGKVKVTGKLPSKAEISKLITTAAAEK